jgi:hypothetical protein
MSRTITSPAEIVAVSSQVKARFLLRNEVVIVNGVVALTVKSVSPSRTFDIVVVDGVDAYGRDMTHVYEGIDAWAQLQGELIAAPAC